MPMNASCFLASTGESAQMLHTPSAQRTTTAISTGKFVAIASCCHVRASDPLERPPRSKPKIWLVRDISRFHSGEAVRREAVTHLLLHQFTVLFLHLHIPVLDALLH